MDEQETAYTSKGELTEYARLVLADLPSLVERPQIFDRAIKLIIRGGLRRSLLDAIAGLEIEGRRGLIAYVASYLPGEVEALTTTGGDDG